jgi:hypothetical protein
MQKIVTIGRRLVPLDHIAVEPFVRDETSDFKPEKAFQARIVVLDRDSGVSSSGRPQRAARRGISFIIRPSRRSGSISSFCLSQASSTGSSSESPSSSIAPSKSGPTA